MGAGVRRRRSKDKNVPSNVNRKVERGLKLAQNLKVLCAK